jgi:hypothetical protein
MPVSILEDKIIQNIRLRLWATMLLVAMLGAIGTLLAIAPDSEAATMANKLLRLMPLFIIIGVAACWGKTQATPVGRAQLQALLNDELRQLSLSRAFRNGFFAMMIVQAPLGLLTGVAAADAAAPLMACLTVTSGLLVALASVLWYDR